MLAQVNDIEASIDEHGDDMRAKGDGVMFEADVGAVGVDVRVKVGEEVGHGAEGVIDGDGGMGFDVKGLVHGAMVANLALIDDGEVGANGRYLLQLMRAKNNRLPILT